MNNEHIKDQVAPEIRDSLSNRPTELVICIHPVSIATGVLFANTPGVEYYSRRKVLVVPGTSIDALSRLREARRISDWAYGKVMLRLNAGLCGWTPMAVMRHKNALGQTARRSAASTPRHGRLIARLTRVLMMPIDRVIAAACARLRAFSINISMVKMLEPGAEKVSGKDPQKFYQ